MPRQKAIDDRMRHPSCISYRVFCVLERIERHAAAKLGVIGANDANVMLMKYQALQETGAEIVKEPDGKIDCAGAERRTRVVQRDRQYARRRAWRFLLEETQQWRQ